MTTESLQQKDYKVSTAELSEILGVTSRRVQQLTKEGALVRSSHGVYDLPSSVQAYMDFIKDKAKTDDEQDKGKEDYLLTKAKRQMAELNLEILQGSLHQSKDVEIVMNDMLSSFRSQMLVLPSKVAPFLIAQTEVEAIKTTVKKYINEALQELSEYDPAAFYKKNKDAAVVEDEETGGELKADKKKEPQNGKARNKTKR